MENKCSLENIVKSVLSAGNKEQNASWSPAIITDQYNTITSLLLSALCKTFQDNQYYTDILEPFMVTEVVSLKDGCIVLPDDYRNLLGSPSVSVKPDGSDCSSVEIKSEGDFKNSTLLAGCKRVPLEIVPQAEFDYRTTSKYAQPTMNNPIGYFKGRGKIKVCPYNIAKVELKYCRKENLVRYGYILQPDDTFIYDKNTSIESEWTSAAFDPIFKGMMSMYAAYTRDNDMRDYSLILNEKGVL